MMEDLVRAGVTLAIGPHASDDCTLIDDARALELAVTKRAGMC
jgi:hypothetical protein